MSSVHITIEGSADEVRAEMSKLLGTHTAQPTVEPATKSPKKEKVAESAGPTPEPKAAEASAGPLDFEKDVKPLIPKLMDKIGKPDLITFLATFGVKKGSELKAEQYGDFVTQANAKLK